MTNGLGIVRHLELFDDDFKAAHPEIQIEKRTNRPEIDKEIEDSTSLKPVLLDFKAAHPNTHYSVFSADATFDSYDNFAFLLHDYGFQKAVVPLNPAEVCLLPMWASTKTERRFVLPTAPLSNPAAMPMKSIVRLDLNSFAQNPKS